MRSTLYSLLVGIGAIATGCTAYVETDHPRPVVVEKPRDKVDVDVNVQPRTAERPRKVDVDVNAPGGIDVDVKR